jgi:hypothetical protein
MRLQPVGCVLSRRTKVPETCCQGGDANGGREKQLRFRMSIFPGVVFNSAGCFCLARSPKAGGKIQETAPLAKTKDKAWQMAVLLWSCVARAFSAELGTTSA